MANDPSVWEAQAVADLIAAAIPELANFNIEVLEGQVDFEKDQLNLAASYLLVACVGSDPEHGHPGADPLTLAFVAVVPGGNQYERRSIAFNAVHAISNWMRGPSAPMAPACYQPLRSAVERVHPSAVATLTASIVG